MDMMQVFKSVLDLDVMPIVLCDTNHTIIYMNKSAVKNYEKYGGEKLLGQNLLNCHNEDSKRKINEMIEWFLKDKNNNKKFSCKSLKHGCNKDIYVVAIRDENENLIGYYEKHEDRTPHE